MVECSWSAMVSVWDAQLEHRLGSSDGEADLLAEHLVTLVVMIEVHVAE